MRTTSLQLVLAAIALQSAGHAQWTIQDAGSRSRLRGVSVVDQGTAWASGSAGNVVRTIDGGMHWQPRRIPGSGDEDVRDVQAFDAAVAIVLAVGPGPRSMILRTLDGGGTWTVAFRNPDQNGFFDAIAFWDRKRGLVQGDPVDGRFVIFSTRDAGATWLRNEPSGMPPALPGEGAFAASGTCLVVLGENLAWFATGGGPRSRVFRSDDGGATWNVSETPIDAGTPSSGIFSLSFRDPLHGVAVGGDYRRPDQGGRICARTVDGGRSWSLPGGPGPSAFRSAVAHIPGSRSATVIAVGPSGADVSLDDGESWKPLGSEGFHALNFSASGAGWAVGEDGRIGKFLSKP